MIHARRASRVPALVATALLAASAAQAQTRGYELLHQQKPIFPDSMSKALKQGNAVLIARMDKSGRLQDIKAVASTHPDFVGPAVAAARLWEFRPALSNGKPIEIAANIGMRFRLDNEQRGQIASPILGDLAVFPADAAGNRSEPDGFPIVLGKNPRLRVEPVLDVSPQPRARSLRVRVAAVSPAGRRVTLADRSVAVAAAAHEVAFPFSAQVGGDWEEGVWILRFTADGADVGGGQFWLARNPAAFDFAAGLRKLTP